MTKRCQSVQDDLKAFIDRELAGPRALSVRCHLLGCETCRKEVSAMQNVTQELREGESDVRVLDAGLRDKIMASVGSVTADRSAKLPMSQSNASLLSRRMSSVAWTGAVAAVLLFVAMTNSFVTTMLNKSGGVSSDAADYSMSAPPPPPPIAAQHSQSRAMLPPSAGPMNFGRYDSQYGAQQKAPARNESSSVRRQLDSVAAGSAAAGNAEADSTAYGSGVYTDTSPQRRVHKQASITVQVGDLEINTAAVEQMTKNVGGYIANNNLDTSSTGLRRSMLTIKVPVAQFETVLSKIGKLGLIQNKQVSGEDITARVSDAEQSKKVLADQLMQQVERLQRAKAQDKPQQRHEARMLQIQLAQARARYNVLSKLATLSTIEVQLQEKAKPKPVPQSGFMEEINKTKISATEAFMSALRIPIIILMWVLAYSPLWIPLLIVYRLASRGHLRRSS
jgi:anti-sigma factor RsiW